MILKKNLRRFVTSFVIIIAGLITLSSVNEIFAKVFLESKEDSKLMPSGATCYMLGPDAPVYRDYRTVQLELDKLEELYKEEKINQKTYEIRKQELKFKQVEAHLDTLKRELYNIDVYYNKNKPENDDETKLIEIQKKLIEQQLQYFSILNEFNEEAKKLYDIFHLKDRNKIDTETYIKQMTEALQKLEAQ